GWRDRWGCLPDASPARRALLDGRRDWTAHGFPPRRRILFEDRLDGLTQARGQVAHALGAPGHERTSEANTDCRPRGQWDAGADGHGAECPPHPNRYQRHAQVERQSRRAMMEPLQRTVAAARAFREGEHVPAALKELRQRLLGGVAR